MYKVLIAEDEMLVRFGLKNSVAWDKYGMVVAGDVSNGQEALDFYHKHKPDVIITDIKMPVMDGMELISRIRQEDDRARIIILSCLDEFDLVRKAMSLGVSDYILKLTMTEDEIDMVLSKVHGELREKERLVAQDISSSPNVDIVMDRLLEDYLFHHLYSSEEFASRLQALGVSLTSENMILAIMEIDHYHELKGRLEGENYFASHTLMSAVNEILERHLIGRAFHDEASRYILILNCNNPTSENCALSKAISVLESVRDSVRVYFNISVSFGLSGMYSGFGHLKTMLLEAEEALDARFYHGYGVFVRDAELDTRSVITEKLKSLYDLFDLFGIPDDSYRKECEEKVRSIIDSLPEQKEHIRELLRQLLYWITDRMHLSGHEIDEVVISHGESLQNIETLEEAIECVRNFVIAVRDCYKKRSVVSPEISEAVRFIRQNYARQISLQDVSEHVALSYSYLSSLFKKELHVTFTEYLNEIRIDKAKELLKSTCLKSYEIAERVGFKESAYFSMLFKKTTGLSPNRYRQTWRQAWKESSEGESD